MAKKRKTLQQVINRNTGVIRKASGSAKTSATAFVDALRNRNNRARRALGLRSYTSKQARNIMRRKSTGGTGG